MASSQSNSGPNPYRLLPSVEEVLGSEWAQELLERAPREFLLNNIQELLDAWRAEIRTDSLDAAAVEQRLKSGSLEEALRQRVRRELGSGLRPVIQAMGVVLHTGLGRAPLHEEAARAMASAARGYCNLEVDRWSGQRNQRDEHLGQLLARLTGAEAGIVVNNNASAVLLTLATFAHGAETIVSRGELVEIGGSFRVPDVMSAAGTSLIEVGTTNRTRIADFRAAAGSRTGLFYKVHESNYRLVGFTESVDPGSLAELGRELGVASAYDLGSGLIDAPGARVLEGLGDEPLVREAVASGVDVVSFSGDKLFGGPQCGMLVGRAEAIAALRKNPLYRALRVDKVTIAGLQKTLELYLDGRGDEIPTRRMLQSSADQMQPVADALAARLAKNTRIKAQVVLDKTQPGSGSAPGVFLDSPVVRILPVGISAGRLADALRSHEPPIFVRVQDDAIWLDPRTLFQGDGDVIATALDSILAE